MRPSRQHRLLPGLGRIRDHSRLCQYCRTVPGHERAMSLLWSRLFRSHRCLLVMLILMLSDDLLIIFHRETKPTGSFACICYTLSRGPTRPTQLLFPVQLLDLQVHQPIFKKQKALSRGPTRPTGTCVSADLLNRTSPSE